MQATRQGDITKFDDAEVIEVEGDNIKMAKKLFCDACDYKNGVVCTKKNKPINKHTTNCKYYSIEKRFPEKPYAPNYADMSPF